MQRFEINGMGEVVPGEAFEIAAATGLASGSRLSLHAPSGVDLLGSQSKPPRSIGGPGQTIYRLSCQTVGDFTIEFTKGRPWETRQEKSQVQIRCRSV